MSPFKPSMHKNTHQHELSEVIARDMDDIHWQVNTSYAPHIGKITPIMHKNKWGGYSTQKVDDKW